MQIEINNPLNTRNRKIAGAVVGLLIISFLALAVVGSSGEEVTEARDLLQEANSEITSSEYGEYDADHVENRLSLARDKLDRAGDSERVEYLRIYADMVGHYSEMMEGINEAGNKFESSISYMDAGRYDDAIQEVQDSESDISSAESSLNQVDSDITELQSYGYESDQLALSDMQNGFQEMKPLIQSIKKLRTGYESLLEGMKDLEEANSYTENEEYARASSYFINAQEHFEDSRVKFNEAEDSTTGEFKADAIQMSCQAKNLRDLSETSSELYQAVVEEDQEEYQRLQDEVDEISNRSCGE